MCKEITNGFASRRAKKTYLALVQGHVVLGSPLFDECLTTDPQDEREYKQMVGTPEHAVCQKTKHNLIRISSVNELLTKRA